MIDMQSVRENRRSIAAMLFGCGGIAALLHWGQFSALPFKDISIMEGALTDILTSLLVVAIFAERSVEVVIVSARTPGRQKLERKIKRIETAAEKDASLLNKLNDELDAYRMETARQAHWLGFALGVMISLAGVRALSGLVDHAALDRAQKAQKIVFALVDVIVTGGVIGGGSAVVDKIGRKIRQSFNLSAATDSRIDNDRRNESEQPKTSESDAH
jgi:hypothetical protein